MTSIRIRWSTPADLTALTDVFARASLSNEGDREALLAHPTALVLEGDSIDKERSRVATHTDHIVGFATMVLIDSVFDLQDLFVDPQWMRQGIGRQLVNDAAAIAARRGVECIAVTANPHALDFYEALGFVVDGKVHTPFGPGQRMHLAVAPSCSSLTGVTDRHLTQNQPRSKPPAAAASVTGWGLDFPRWTERPR